MSTAKRIQEILDCEVLTPVRDDAKILTTSGIESAVKIRTLQECLKIARQEEAKLASTNSPLSIKLPL